MLSIDWLQWSGYLIGDGLNSLPELECPDGYRLEILNGNNIFKFRAILYDCLGRKCVTMLWRPKSPLIQWNLVTFQVANIWFYQIEDIQLTIALAARCFNYQFATFSRIDICCDFECNRNQRNIIKGIYHNKIYCAGKRAGSMFWSKVDNEVFPHDFNFGSIQSSIKWKLYNKTLELKIGTDEEDKTYISDRWLENNMNKYRIWRLEVSINDFNKFYIRNKPIMKNGKIDYTCKHMILEDITDVTIMEIFCDLYENRFQLRKKKHTRSCNDERVYIVKLEQHKIVTPYQKEESNHVDNSTMHHLIKVIESDGAKMNEKMLNAACESLFYYVKFNKLDKLFKNLKGKEITDYCEEMLNLAGEGIVSYLDNNND